MNIKNKITDRYKILIAKISSGFNGSRYILMNDLSIILLRNSIDNIINGIMIPIKAKGMVIIVLKSSSTLLFEKLQHKKDNTKNMIVTIINPKNHSRYLSKNLRSFNKKTNRWNWLKFINFRR